MEGLMDWLRILLSRCSALFRTKQLADDLDEELHSHIEFAIEENLRRGMSPREARLKALDEFGGAAQIGLAQVKEAYHRQQSLPFFETLSRDVRYALRQLRKSPGFAITAIVTLALGIGANTVMFTLVDSIMLRPLPFAHQEQLMRISGTTSEVFPKGWIRELATHSSSFASISGFGADVESNIANADSPDRVFGAAVMVNALDTLGTHPALGSFFIRLALGARRWQIVSGIVKQSLLLAGGGSLAGLIAAFGLTHLLHSFLFEVSAIDPLTFCAVPLVMMLVALIAAGIPAWRAAALDPMRALRAE
jgi:hypothetical protein